MPSPKQAMYAALAGDSAIAGIVGGKVYPDQAKSDVEPYLVFQSASDVKPATLRATVGIRRIRFQLVGVCRTRAEAQALQQAIEALLHGKAQTSFGGVLVKSSLVSEDEGEVDEDEAPRPGVEFGLRSVRLDVIWWV